MQVTHNCTMESTLKMQYYPPSSSNDQSSSSANNSSASKKRRCLNNKEEMCTSAGESMSHRVIEKRRRDRMNNCLADLGKLIPAEYLKKDRGRVEKTEIIEMAIRHMKHLQGLRKHCTLTTVHTEENGEILSQQPENYAASSVMEHYRLGFQECLSETMHFLVDNEGGFYGRDTLYVQLIGHLQRHCENITTASNDSVSFTQSAGIQGFNGITSDCPDNINSDNGSSSGVSSFGASDSPERPSTRPIVSAPIQTTMNISSDDSNSSSDTPIIAATTATNYKFKSSIKQRFSAERVDSSSSPTSLPRANFDDKQSRGVPIFALHDGGEFYVPLIIESALLRPYVAHSLTPAEKGPTDVARVGADIVLHPVTISVNFYQSPAPSTSLVHHQTCAAVPTTQNNRLLRQ